MKKCLFLLVSVFPLPLHAQILSRLDHTLPQYRNLPSSQLKIQNQDATALDKAFKKNELNSLAKIPEVYTDGSTATLQQIGRIADGSVQQTDIGFMIAPLDSNKMMSAPVSGDSSASPILAAGSTVLRKLADREADTINLSNFISQYDGSDTFKSKVLNLYQKLPSNAIITMPCGVTWPFYDMKTGYAWGPSGKGVLFVDTCGSAWNNPPGWATPTIDRGLGDNNPVISQWNGTILLNRQNTSSTNWNGLFSSHIVNWANKTGQWGSVDADFTNGYFVIDNNRFTLDGKSPTRGSPVALRAVVNNYSNQTWEVQAQAFKPTCNNFTWGGSCWGISTELNDKSGHSAKPWNLTNENDLEANGPDNIASTWQPKQSYKFMDYASAIAYTPAAWKAHTHYQANNSKVIVKDINNQDRILIAKNSGISGVKQPVITNKEGTQTTDGTIVWDIGTTLDNVVGVVHWINNDGGNSPSNHASYNFGYSTNAKFNNAVFDTSHAQMNNKRTVAIRIGSDQGIDVSASRNAESDGDINKNVWKYISQEHSYDYFVNGKREISITDSGDLITTNAIIPATKTRSEILSTKPIEGLHPIYYDSTDDAPAVYTNKGWKLMVLAPFPKD